jgi:DNA processing protein
MEARDGSKRRRPADLKAAWAGTHGAAPEIRSWPARFAATPEDRSALVVLLGLAALTPRRLLELAATRRTAAACLAAVRAGQAGSEGDRTAAAAADPDRVTERLSDVGARLVAVGDPEYPARLLDLFDPPAGLFVMGRPLKDDVPCVAMVGARNCSAAGAEVAAALAEALSRAGVCVVSGAARGVDLAAHQGALRGGVGGTAAVLGCGIDVAYPHSHRKLFRNIGSTGTIVSEYPPGVPAEPFRFPARNRIVAALSRAVVVVEGAEGSGSMITADHALEIGREVFAVPGPISSPLSAVPLSLIRQGATLIRGPNDLLEDLGLNRADTQPSDPSAGMDPPTRAVWTALVAPSPPDQVARAAGLGVGEAIGILVSLELRGLVRQVGGRYERRLAT